LQLDTTFTGSQDMETTLSIATRRSQAGCGASRPAFFHPSVAAVATIAVMAWFATGLALLLGEWQCVLV